MKKITQDVDYVTINFAENGFIVEYSGRTEDDSYHNTKLLCSTIEDTVAELKSAIKASEYKD